MQHTIDIIGVKGTPGALNILLKFGIVFLSTITAADTTVKPNNVPILKNCTMKSSGKNPAIIAAIVPVIIVDIYGVLCVGCTFENNFGKSPSIDITMNIL